MTMKISEIYKFLRQIQYDVEKISREETWERRRFLNVKLYKEIEEVRKKLLQGE